MSSPTARGPVRVAIVGVGNCASSLVQGVHLYRHKPPGDTQGLMHPVLGGYRPGDLEVVAAFDVDARKVGRDLRDALNAPPNCTVPLAPDLPATGVVVRRGPVLDGVAEHMRLHPPERSFVVAEGADPGAAEMTDALRRSGAQVLVNYLPVGSEEATRFWARCALDAGVALVNCIPVFVASDPAWAQAFADRRLPLVGDDVKSQLGATITHRTLAELFARRGVSIDRTYQLNTGGNTDFLNMLDRHRLASKRRSKTEAVTSMIPQSLPADDVHVGPSDYVPWQKDRKVCFVRIEGRLFGGVPMDLELRLSVEDSPNSAGVVIDAVRCAKVALDRGVGGVLHAASSAFCKRPPQQRPDHEAHEALERFLAGDAAAR
ncbi:MAG: inositol-3-phosphate synthase [Planctomycetes bacterium]|nr:inositol-3-phosphate synthase [Planctomycetota bacterium]